MEPIQYNERTRTTGLDGEIFYNLDRTLTGNQTLELLTTETPGAVFENKITWNLKFSVTMSTLMVKFYQKRKPC